MGLHRSLTVPLSVALLSVGACTSDSDEPALEGISHISEVSSPRPAASPGQTSVPSTEASVTSLPTAPSRSPTPTTSHATTPPPATTPSTDSEPDESEPDAIEPDAIEKLESEVVELTNAERTDHGCGVVKVDDDLRSAARGHSRDMADRDYFSHTTPEGVGPGDRASDAGYEAWGAENIAMGYPNAEAVIEGWMNSEGHRANILNCDLTEIGVGVTDSARGLYWTQMFGFG